MKERNVIPHTTPIKIGAMASSPGKLILSGEHAVVYGNPAVAIALPQSVTTHITPAEKNITFYFDEFGLIKTFTFDALKTLQKETNNRYQQFLSDELDIESVLTRPETLCYLAFMAANLHNDKTPLSIHIKTTIPLGCGMGSSAAAILSVMRATYDFFEHPIDETTLLREATHIEHYRHGISSGLDVFISHHGGMTIATQGEFKTHSQPHLPFQFVLTGKPTCSTGECVTYVASHFKDDKDCWKAFESTTLSFIQALEQHDTPTLLQAIQNNHRLLTKIGVVPKRIQAFISDIETLGGAAKICGAGAITGEQAGMVLVSDNVDITDLCRKYHFSVLGA